MLIRNSFDNLAWLLYRCHAMRRYRLRSERIRTFWDRNLYIAGGQR
jgi:hypothetical protein